MKHRRKGYKYIRLGHCEDPIGYCHYHHSEMSKNQIKSKECLKKGCAALQRYEDHPYWINYEKIKKKKRGGNNETKA